MNTPNLNERLNKYVDLADRTIWTFIQAFLAFIAVDAFWSDDLSWGAKLGGAAIAALIAAAKTVVAQRTGNDELGDLVPGQDVIQP